MDAVQRPLRGDDGTGGGPVVWLPIFPQQDCSPLAAVSCRGISICTLRHRLFAGYLAGRRDSRIIQLETAGRRNLDAAKLRPWPGCTRRFLSIN